MPQPMVDVTHSSTWLLLLELKSPIIIGLKTKDGDLIKRCILVTFFSSV